MLLEKGRGVLHTVHELEKQVIKQHESWKNELVIGVDDTFTFSLLAPLIDAFINATVRRALNLLMAFSWFMGDSDTGKGGHHCWHDVCVAA